MMAKMLKKTLAMVIALTMLLSLPLTAVAETTKTTTDNGDGTKTTITTTTTTETDANGNTTVTVKIEEGTSGTLADENTVSGVKVDSTETTTTTTVTNPEGDVIASNWVVDGEETKEWTEIDDGNEPGQPEVEVPLIPGETTSAASEPKVEVTGTVNSEQGQTTTTTTERTVEASTTEIVVTEEEKLDFEMESMKVEKKEGAADLTWSGSSPMSSSYYDWITFGDEGRYVPRFTRTEDQMTEELKPFYDEKTEEVKDDEGNVIGTKVTYVPKAAEGKTNLSNSNGEFILFNVGEASPYLIYFEGKGPDDACSIALTDEYGKMLFTYCMDKNTNTSGGVAYIMENLEDADYFKGTEEEQQAAKDQVRAIALKGYWGTAEGTGSLSQLKTDLKAFIESNPDFTFTYTNPNPAEGEDASREFSVAENKDYLMSLVDQLNEAGAVTVTQSAIWEYGNRNSNPEYVHNNKEGVEASFNHALALLRNYLLDPRLQDTVESKETIIYDEDSFLKEDGMSLTVGDKIQDNGGTGDVYNVDMTFTLVVVPGEKDDLMVCLVDSNGNMVRKARIAGEALEGEETDEIVKGEDGSYTFTDVPVQEDSNITFNLRLEGVQYLEQGVYIYKHIKSDGSTDYDTKQTLVGIAEGNHEVDVTAAFTVNFSVDENNHVVAERIWHDQWDPSYEPGLTNDPGDDPDEDPDEETIPDEEVPLAAAPETGDPSLILAAMSLLSAGGLVVINKKKDEE